MTTLIYCAAGNKRFAEIAIRRGYQYGAQLPNTIYYPPYFTDQDWKKPNRAKYMEALKHYRPTIATVLDWERVEQFEEVMSWAEEASGYVTEAVIIIPKVVGGVARLPRFINGKQVRLGYSASSTFSSTPVGLHEFKGWPAHCLGGSVKTQKHLHHVLDLVTADGNYIQNLARRRCQFYSPGIRAKSNGWPLMREVGLGHLATDSIYVAFELTCIAVPMAFNGRPAHEIYEAQVAWLMSENIEPAMIQKSMWERTNESL